MSSIREEIEELTVDCYTEDEQMAAWGVAFEDGVKVPFKASLLGIPVEVQEFSLSDADTPQCLVLREDKERWIGVEDLDEEGLPEDFQHVMMLYQAWLSGDY